MAAAVDHVGTIAAAGSDEKSHVVTSDGGQQTTAKAESSDLRVLDNATIDSSTYKQAGVVQTAQVAPQSSAISTGDKVFMNFPSTRVQELRQSGSEIAEWLGWFGRVEEFTPGGMVVVAFGENKLSLSRDVVKKVPKISVGDRVKVQSDEVQVVALQDGRLGYNANMRSALGKVGEVVKKTIEGDVVVQFEGQNWCFSPACLTPAPGQPVDAVVRGDGGTRSIGEREINMVNEVLQAFASAAAASTAQTADGTIFFHAVINNALSDVKLMLKQAPALVRIKERGVMAIHLAAIQGHVRMVQLLLKNGAKLEDRDDDGETALIAGMEHKAMAECLIKKGSNVNAANKKGHTASIKAAAFGHTQILRLLASKGADFNAQDVDGATPLHIAIDFGRLAAAEVLIGWPRIDLRRINNRRLSPLFFAAMKGNASVAELLLKKDRSLVNEQKRYGFSALHVAALNNNTDVMKVLVEKGQARLNLKSYRFHTPLHIVAQEANMDGVQLLIKHGADIEAKDCDGYTPLHILLCTNTAPMGEDDLIVLGQASQAKLEKRVQIACCLLHAGASLQARNDEGKTALEQCKNQAIVDGVKQFLAANPSLDRPPGAATQRPASGQQCLRCSSRRANVLLDPCGHRVVCTQCCAKLQSCPQCNNAIKNMYDETGKDLKGKCSVM